MLLDRRHHTKHPIAAIVVPTLILAITLIILSMLSVRLSPYMSLDGDLRSALRAFAEDPLWFAILIARPLAFPTALILAFYAVWVYGCQGRVSLLLYLQKYAPLWSAFVYAIATCCTWTPVAHSGLVRLQEMLAPHVAVPFNVLTYVIAAPLVIGLCVTLCVMSSDFDIESNDNKQHWGPLTFLVAITTIVAVILTCAHPWYLAIIAIPSLLPALVLIPRRPYGIDEPGIYCAEE